MWKCISPVLSAETGNDASVSDGTASVMWYFFQSSGKPGAELLVFPDAPVIRSDDGDGNIEVFCYCMDCYMKTHGIVNEIMEQGTALKIVKQYGDEKIYSNIGRHDNACFQTYGIDLYIHYDKENPQQQWPPQIGTKGSPDLVMGHFNTSPRILNA